MDKLLILDKDGTLVAPKSGNTFVQSPEDQQLLPGVKQAIERYQSEGWVIVVASNQGGVEAGHKTLEDAIAEMRYCMKLLRYICPDYRFTSGCPVWEALFCPDFAGEQCWSVQWGLKAMPIHECEWIDSSLHGQFRKPNPGMILFAKSRSQYKDVLFVGDRDEDRLAAEAAGVQFMGAEQWRAGK